MTRQVLETAAVLCLPLVVLVLGGLLIEMRPGVTECKS